MRTRTLYIAGGVLGIGSLLALLALRRSGTRLLPGEPNWFLGRPLERMIVTEGWGMPREGRIHGAIDLRAAVGTPFFAAAPGRILFAGTYTDGNTAIELDHGDGMVTRYLHHSQAHVSKGDVVKKGQRLGLTGFAKSPHLHFDTSILPSQVPMYRARFGNAKGLGDQTAILAGTIHVRVPSEPLVPIDFVQADVLAMTRTFGVALPPTPVVA